MIWAWHPCLPTGKFPAWGLSTLVSTYDAGETAKPPIAIVARLGGPAAAIDLASRILGVVPDPFPRPPPARVLIVSEDTAPARALAREFEVVHVDDGWAAIDWLEKAEFDVILCSLRIGGMSGASFFRVVAKTLPEAAAKIAFLASAATAAAAPPSSASGRIVASPLTAERVRALIRP